MVLSRTCRFPVPGSALFPIPTVSRHSRVRPSAVEVSRVSYLPGLASVEAYSYKTNEWFFVAPMNTRRSSVGVGVVEGKEQQWVAACLGPSPRAFSWFPGSIPFICSESGTSVLISEKRKVETQR